MKSTSMLLSVLLLSVLAGCGHEEKPVIVQPVSVTTERVQNTTTAQVFSYSGTIEPDNTVQIGFAVSGIVNQVAVQEGQFVQQGQLLASIDANDYINALAIANAGLEQAEDMYTRLNGLYEKGSLPAKDFIEIKTKLAQARANKSINAKHIADSRLYAPMSGIITAKLIERGSTAAPGVPAFTIVKTDRVYAKISVPESEVGNLKRDAAAQVFIPALNDSVKGNITIINPQGDAVSKTYAVKIRLDNGNGKLLPGMIANVQVHTAQRVSVMTIPATAVVRDADDLSYVFVANTANKAIRKRVTTGTLTGVDRVTITDGLQPGDNIIIAGQSKLKDGAAISVK